MSSPGSAPGKGGRPAGWPALGLVLAAVAVYANSLRGPFVYLDVAAIPQNPSIRHLWPLWNVLQPSLARGVTVGGRPLVNLSFALNYAFSADRVLSYHLVNVLIHVAAGLTLFGILRRSLLRTQVASAELIAWFVALLWTVHPLQTESVTYLVQRAESLMGLFYLLTLYCFIQWVERDLRARWPGPSWGQAWLWAAASVLTCLLGMATKEVMVSAPVIVLLYDRTFIAPDFSTALRKRWGYYAALAATWLPLAWLVHSIGGNRGGTSGFGLPISWWGYLCTQFPAILHYLRLAVWPHPLVFYYEVNWVHGFAVVLPGIAICAVAFSALVGVIRRSAWGFIGTVFFAVLAPTSLVPGMSQTLAEHRMYLPLAAVLVVVVAAIVALARRAGLPQSAWVIFAALAVLYGALTFQRNTVYASEVRLWEDTAAKAPGNPYSQNNLAIALIAAHRPEEAIERLRTALTLDPHYAEAFNNLGMALAETGRPNEAIPAYERALALHPNDAEARGNLGMILLRLGRKADAIAQFEAAVRVAPTDAQLGNNLAAALAITGRMPEAIERYRQVLVLNPSSAETHYNLANAYSAMGRWDDAVGEYSAAVRLNPQSSEAYSNLGAALGYLKRWPEAVAADRRAAALAPADPDIHENLGAALRAVGENRAAEKELAEAVRLRTRR